MKKILSVIVLSFVLFLSIAPLALAEDAPSAIDKPVFDSMEGLLAFVNKIINWIFVALLVTAVVMILLAAFDFLTAGGDSAKVAKAQQKLLFALIAVVIGALAKGLVMAVGGLLGVKTTF